MTYPQPKDWPKDSERIDIIGQNGNTGCHYAKSKRKNWSFEESKILIQLIKNKTKISDITKNLIGRNEKAIRIKIHKLGYSTKGL